MSPGQYIKESRLSIIYLKQYIGDPHHPKLS
jgi:hypothetical protein